MNNISNELERVISQMSKPLNELPLELVIEKLSGKKVIPFDKNNKMDIEVLEVLKNTAGRVLEKVNTKGILRSRANEVGNDIEPFVKEALKYFGYKADTPKTANGKKKSSGYPDIEFIDKFNRINYLECKTYNIKNINTTQRSFFISPSNEFKITQNAHHFGISFEVYVENSIRNKHLYKIKSWKILDLSKLKLDIKYEFNSDNKRMYNKDMIIGQQI